MNSHGSNLGLLHYRQILYPLRHQGHPPKFIQLVNSTAGIFTWVSLAPKLMLFTALILSHFLPVGLCSHFLCLPWCLRKLSGGFPDSSVGKESTRNAGDPSSIPGLGRSAGDGIGYPLQYSWTSLVAQLVKNPPVIWETWVGKIPWRREQLPTPVFWPGDCHGLYSPWGHKESDTTGQLFLFLRGWLEYDGCLLN